MEYHLTILPEEAAQGCAKIIEYERRRLSGEVESRRLEVKLPASMEEGAKIRLKGQGEQEWGDLFIHVNVISRANETSPSPDSSSGPVVSEVDQKNLDYYIAISPEEATQGCAKIIEYERRSISGEVESRRLEAKLPRGVTDGTKIRLKGQGQPGWKDLFIHVKVGIIADADEEDLNRMLACYCQFVSD